MSISAESVRLDEDSMWIALSDGRRLGVPLAWFPRLLHAAPRQRAAVDISRGGLHWEALDEDISVAGLLAGRGIGRRGPRRRRSACRFAFSGSGGIEWTARLQTREAPERFERAGLETRGP